MLSLRLRTHGAALLTALVGTCVLAVPAGAATKPFSVVVSPNTVPAGASVPFKAKITNGTTTQTLGSANLTLPAGFSILSVSVPPPATRTFTTVDNRAQVQLRNLGVAPGQSVTATVEATVPSTPCGGAGFAWQAAAKQSNDFNGTGNDFTLQTAISSLTTSTTCGGTATECPGANCVNTLTDPVTASFLTVSTPDSGLLTLTRGGGLDCAGYAEVLPKVDFGVDFLPDPGTVAANIKIVTLNISKAAMQASTNNGLAQVNICFGAPFFFDVKPGTQALQPGPGGFSIGLLPDCLTPIPNTSPPRVAGPPCVSDRQSVGGGAAITVRAPGGDKDPRYGT